VLVSALEQMRAKQLLGDVTIVLHRGAGAYICGEETALLESLEGRRGQPRTKPPFPAIAGLYASPTAVNNVESITSATSVLEIGGAEYAKLGIESSRARASSRSPATSSTAATTSLPHGFPLRDLINDLGGGDRRRPQPQGSDPGRIVDRDPDRDETNRVTLDFDSLVGAGTAIGSAP
jgi:NADH-quinone oxidoreductase subunit F